MLKFPKDFNFGASISAMQTEGKGTTEIGKLTFDTFFEEKPERFFDGVGPEITSDIMNHYKSDIKMMAEMKLEGLRTGFSWARLFPDGKTVNKNAVEYYHNFIKELKNSNIKVFMTLFHFDMPMWAQIKGAWSSNEVIESFINYAKFVFKEYGNEVEYFVTFNEPLNPVLNGYTGNGHYPCLDDPKQAVQQAYGIFLAHAKCTVEFHKMKFKIAKIGVVFDWNYSYVVENNEENILAEKIFDAYVNRGPLNIMYNGKIDDLIISSLKEFDMLPKYNDLEISIINRTRVDFLGINFYFPSRIRASKNKNPRWALEKTDRYIPEGARMNPYRGWEIEPKCMYDLSMAIQKEFKNIPWYVAENGMGVENEEIYRGDDGIIADDYRIEFYKEHLTELKKGMDNGSNCFGYHAWTAIDCWSFTNAYKNRYGFIEVDLKDQSRKFKKSASWYKNLIEIKNN